MMLCRDRDKESNLRFTEKSVRSLINKLSKEKDNMRQIFT